MAQLVTYPEEELRRRETYLRANQRPHVWYDPFTWTYPARTALTGAGVAIIAITGHNIMNKKPWHFGLFYRAAGVAVFVVAGYGTGKLREHNLSTRNAVVDHYMSLHPSDFELVNNRYGRPYSSVLTPWVPFRAEYRNFDPEPEKTSE